MRALRWIVISLLAATAVALAALLALPAPIHSAKLELALALPATGALAPNRRSRRARSSGRAT
jgi:hypothetical protein